MKIQLIIVFNHRYDANIPVLANYYKQKFSGIKFLVPGYDGSRKDVIDVHRYVSFNFAGYFEEGYKRYRSDEADYYMFLADDALLNPRYDEKTVSDILLENRAKAYITDIQPCNRKNGIGWYHAVFMNLPFVIGRENLLKFVPDYKTALKKANDFFGSYPESFSDEFYVDASSREEYKKRRYKAIFDTANINGNKIIYPLAGGWSDIVVVHKSIIHDFVRLCGIFSSMHFFCEIAIPTALMLLCERNEIIKLSDLTKNSGISQEVLWKDDRIKLVDKYKGKLVDLIKDFSDKKLLVHPIKLSQWDVNGI